MIDFSAHKKGTTSIIYFFRKKARVLEEIIVKSTEAGKFSVFAAFVVGVFDTVFCVERQIFQVFQNIFTADLL